MRLKISSGKCRPSCLGLNVLKEVRTYIVAIRSDRSWPLLHQIMAFRRLGVKPFPKTTETYCQLNHRTNFKGYLHKNIRIKKNPFEILSAKGTFVSTGPFHWRFFHHNSNSMEISFSCKLNYWYRNKYISHGRTAVVPCAKFCSDHFIKMWMRVWWNSHHIWIVMEKICKWIGLHRSEWFNTSAGHNEPSAAHTFTGQQSGDVFLTTEEEIQLRFISDASGTGRGFKIGLVYRSDHDGMCPLWS